MDWLMGNSFFILLLLICVGMHIFGHGHSHDHATHKSEREQSPDDPVHDSHRRKL
jgi:hypothetical protein